MLLKLPVTYDGSPPDAFTAKYLSSQDAKRTVKVELKAEVMRRRQALRSTNLSLKEERIED